MPTVDPSANSKPGRRGLGSWVLRNAALALVVYAAYLLIPSDTTMNWLWNSYCKRNLNFALSHPNASLEERLMTKLGNDYKFLTTVRNMTPPNAIIYYPTRADFTTPPKGMEKSPFTGKIIDKLAAVRVLYPRRVITVNEWGKTPWAARTSHVMIVNGFNRDKLPYRVGEDYIIGVLPTDVQAVMREINQAKMQEAARQAAQPTSRGPVAKP